MRKKDVQPIDKADKVSYTTAHTVTIPERCPTDPARRGESLPPGGTVLPARETVGPAADGAVEDVDVVLEHAPAGAVGGAAVERVGRVGLGVVQRAGQVALVLHRAHQLTTQGDGS